MKWFIILIVVRLILGCNTEEAYVYAYSFSSIWFSSIRYRWDRHMIFDHFRGGEGGIPKFLRIPVLFAASIPPLLRDHWLHIDYSNIDFRFYLCLQILSDRSFWSTTACGIPVTHSEFKPPWIGAAFPVPSAPVSSALPAAWADTIG